MVSLKLWVKKLKFYKKKNILFFLLMILPLMLFSSITLIFFNGYFESFEEYYHQNTSSDITVYTKYDNFQAIHTSLEEDLVNYPYKGFVARSVFSIDINISIFNPNSQIISINNHSTWYSGMNFSGKIFKNSFINKNFPLTSGRLPKKNNETIVPFEYKKIYNFSSNAIVNFQYYEEINFNVTVVGFYDSSLGYRHTPSNKFIFFIDDLNNQIFQKFKADNYPINYDIFLDHKEMDCFNINSFVSKMIQTENIIRIIFSNSTGYNDISSSSMILQGPEFNQYIIQIFLDLVTIAAPVILIVIIFSVMLSANLCRIEEDYWNKANFFLSHKRIKKQIFLELLLNNTLSFIIAIPLGIGLVILVKCIFFDISEFELYLPFSFFILSLLFFIWYFLLIYYKTVKTYNTKVKMNKYESPASNLLFKKKSKNIIILLSICAILPILTMIVYFAFINYYNPILTTTSVILNLFSNFISIFYSIILILLIITVIPGIIIKYIRLFSKIPLTKLKNTKSSLCNKFFNFRYLSTLIFVGMLSLEIGFLNFYHFKNVNQINQEEFEIYLKYGSDFKIVEHYTNENLLNLSVFIADNSYCQIEGIPGKIQNSEILWQEIALLNFNPNRYYSVLSQKSQSVINKDFISQINALEINEILVPTYLKIRYNLKIGDVLSIQPQNASIYGGEFVDILEKSMHIKGFFDFLPGLDQDLAFFNTLYTEKGMIMITSPSFNYTSEFKELPTSGINLIRDIDDNYSILKSIIYNNTAIKFTSKKGELDLLNKSYPVIISNSITLMYSIFIIIFLIMSFLYIFNFIIENQEFWNLFQLFNLSEKFIKRFIFWGLMGIFTVSFIIGSVGILSSILVFSSQNFIFKYNYYIYPIQFIFDITGLVFNLLYISITVFLIWLIPIKIMNFKLNYKKLRKYNPE